MPVADKDPIQALRESIEAYTAAAATFEQARHDRDEAIRALSRAGMSRRAVATMAGLTVGRVQQIIDAE
jgi:hypothetical protein